MTLAPWFISGVFFVISFAVIVGAKRYWVKGIGLLFGLLFLQDFLQKFTRDTTALIISLFIAVLAATLLIMGKRRKAKKKEEERQRGGTVINIGTDATRPTGRHRGP